MRHTATQLLRVCGLVAVVASFVACGSHDKDGGKTRLVVWGTTEGEAKVGYDSLITIFERKHPDITVVRAIPERGQDLQKLLTAYVGGDPPDVVHREARFLGNLAARGILRPLDDLIAGDVNDPDGVHESEYYAGSWAEEVYDGKVYGVPGYTSPSVFAYNRNLFREVGLDPDRPPRTWAELKEYALKLTRFDENGDIERVGFFPNFRGMDPLHLYIRQLGGTILDSTGQKAQYDSPEALEGLQFMKELYDLQGGRTAVQAFAMATLQSGGVDAFQQGKVAMTLDDDYIIYRTARYGDLDILDLAVTLPPMPSDTMRPVAYERGSLWGIPSNAKNVDAAWEFISFLQSKEGYTTFRRIIAEQDMREKGMMYVGLHARRQLNAIQADFMPPQPELQRETLKIADMMEYAWAPRPTAVASFLWDTEMEALDNATYGLESPERALEIAQSKAQDELDRYYGPPVGPLVNWWNVSLFVVTVFLVGIGVLWYLSRREKGTPGLGKGEFWAGMAFLSPWTLGFLVFTAGPIVFSIIISFTQFEVISPARWVGFDNYVFLLTQDPTFWKSLWNTLFMALGIPIGMAMGLGIAMLLNANVKGLSVYRTIYYFPAIVPVVASAILWVYVLHPKLGVFNIFLNDTGLTAIITWCITKCNVVLTALGFDPVDRQFWLWIQSEDWSKPGLIVMSLWGAGASMIIWLAGLKGIPQHLYEAAEIDGAGPIRKFTSVTLPMLSPYIFFNLVTGVIGTFQIFTQAFVMTLGGPAQSTLFYVYYLFNNAFSYFRMGYASAMAWILFIIILLLTLIQIKGAKRWVHYE